jgi:hypothetical protein
MNLGREIFGLVLVREKLKIVIHQRWIVDELITGRITRFGDSMPIHI